MRRRHSVSAIEGRSKGGPTLVAQGQARAPRARPSPPIASLYVAPPARPHAQRLPHRQRHCRSQCARARLDTRRTARHASGPLWSTAPARRQDTVVRHSSVSPPPAATPTCIASSDLRLEVSHRGDTWISEGWAQAGLELLLLHPATLGGGRVRCGALGRRVWRACARMAPRVGRMCRRSQRERQTSMRDGECIDF